MSLLKTIIIGAASQRGEEYIKALSSYNNVKIVACIVNNKISDLIQNLNCEVILNGNLDKAIKTIDFDLAILAVPHHQHDYLTKRLLSRGVYIIKEKPLALIVSKANFYKEFLLKNEVPPIFTTVQRQTMPVFVEAFKVLHLIGDLKFFSYEYLFNLSEVTIGWRVKKQYSGGGVVMDMGYHAIDVMNNFFGTPEKINSVFGYFHKETKEERVEDYAKFFLTHFPKHSNLYGTVVLNLHAKNKKEEFIIEGSTGKMSITPLGYEVCDYNGKVLSKASFINDDKQKVISEMFNFCLNLKKKRHLLHESFNRNIKNVEIIEKIYTNLIP